MTQVTFHDSATIAYTYDAGDRVTQIVDSVNGTITRTYDGLDRLTQEATPQGTVTYTYDADGRRATMTVAGQTAVSYGYDNAHRLTSVTQGSATVALAYDNADRRSTLTFPNGIVATYAYDNANHLTSLTYTLGQTMLGTLTYTYDAAGNRTSVGGTWARTGLPAALASATYDAANRITAWGGTNFSYDLNGNLTNDGTRTYTWNARNQLTALGGSVTANFQYDGLGRRRSRTVSGTSRGFLYDGLNLVQELASGSPVANLLTGLTIDETFTRALSGSTETLLADALGSTLALANGSGSVQTEYAYEPFGATLASGMSSTNTAQFTGRENDATGLYSYRTRYYHPGTGRFASEDPAGLGGGLNLFVYAENRPTLFVDPLGLKPDPRFGGPGGGPGGNGPRGNGPGGSGPGGTGPGGNGPGGSGPGPHGPGPGSNSPPKCSSGSGGGPGAFSTTAIADLGFGIGPAVSVTYVPATGELFIAPGIGVSLGHNVSFGPLVGANPSGVLPGWSFGTGYQPTFTRGVQGVGNSSGALGGNSVGVPGVAATVTYGFCF